MTKSFDKEAQYRLLFKAFKKEADARKIESAVMAQIENSRLKKVRCGAFCFGLIALFSITALKPAFDFAYFQARQSGFSDFVTLLSDHAGDLADSWSILLLSLVESVPIIGLILIFTAIFTATVAARYLALDLALIKKSSLNSH